MTLAELLHDVPLRSVRGGTDVSINDIQYDSRAVRPGDVFVAIRGATADGHRFIGDAVARGAAAVVVEDEHALVGDVLVVVVDNTRSTLADLAHARYGFPTKRATVIGVTGTNGKTTTTYILRHLLDDVGLIGTIERGFGSSMVPATRTTPESVDLCRMIDGMIAGGARTIAMEVSSHALALDRVRGFQFAAAVFTNLTQDHLDFHGTMEEYAGAKARLFAMLPQEAFAVLNADDAYAATMARATQANVVWYGFSDTCAVRAHAIRFSLDGTEIDVSVHGARHTVISPYLGTFNVYNLLGGIGVAASLGMSHREIVRRIPSLPQVRGRLERVPLPNGAVAVVDYAHTPDALERAIETVRAIAAAAGGRVITLFGCGGDRDATKRPIMGRIAATMSDRTVITSDNPRSEDPAVILRDVLAGVLDRSTVSVVEDRGEAIRLALDQSRPGDVVLLAGKGHETTQVIGVQQLPFDDAAHARAWAAIDHAPC